MTKTTHEEAKVAAKVLLKCRREDFMKWAGTNQTYATIIMDCMDAIVEYREPIVPTFDIEAFISGLITEGVTKVDFANRVYYWMHGDYGKALYGIPTERFVDR